MVRFAALVTAVGAGVLTALWLNTPASAEPEMLTLQPIPAGALADVPAGTLGATTGGVCPEGWRRVQFEGSPLFMAVGMLTDASGSAFDANGRPFSDFRVLVACSKE